MVRGGPFGTKTGSGVGLGLVNHLSRIFVASRILSTSGAKRQSEPLPNIQAATLIFSTMILRVHSRTGRRSPVMRAQESKMISPVGIVISQNTFLQPLGTLAFNEKIFKPLRAAEKLRHSSQFLSRPFAQQAFPPGSCFCFTFGLV